MHININTDNTQFNTFSSQKLTCNRCPTKRNTLTHLLRFKSPQTTGEFRKMEQEQHNQSTKVLLYHFPILICSFLNLNQISEQDAGHSGIGYAGVTVSNRKAGRQVRCRYVGWQVVSLQVRLGQVRLCFIIPSIKYKLN